MSALAGRTLFISGASRGIGLAIAARAGQDGANVAFLAKTDVPDPRLPGTVHTAAAAIEAAGGRALPMVGDVRDAAAVEAAVERAVAHFGGIDCVVNNASALDLSPTEALQVKRFDLMQAINSRGTFVLTRACVPHLCRSPAPHILTLSPPLNLDPKWLGRYPGYMLSKYGMTLLTLGFAAEFEQAGIHANCLWPRTTIATAAVQNLVGGEAGIARSRRPEIVSDAAHAILTSDATGRCFLDDEVLGDTVDLDGYRVTDHADGLELDFFVDRATVGSGQGPSS